VGNKNSILKKLLGEEGVKGGCVIDLFGSEYGASIRVIYRMRQK